MIEIRWLIQKYSRNRYLQYREITEGMDGYTQYGEWQDVPVEEEE